MAGFLITGSAGFMGRHLSRELCEAGHEVPDAGLDITDYSACERVVREIAPDYVIHLAAISHVAHGSTEDFYKVNVVGTDNLLGAIAALPVPPRKVVLASSANIYGNAAGDAPIPESAPLRPANHYGVSKAAMEMVAAMYADRLPITIVRPFNLTGPGQSPSFLIPKLVEAFVSGASAVTLGNLDVSRDFSDVRDIARYFRVLAESAPAGTTVNLCSGVTWSFRNVFDTLAEITGHRPEIITDPALVRANEIKVLTGDRSRLSSLLGPEDAGARDFTETLRWMVDSRRAVPAP